MSQTANYLARVRRRERSIELRGVDHCVHEWGAAGHPTLVLLHGWGDVGASFQFTVDALERDWHVIAPDWRGFGDSGHNAASYWFPDYIADLDAVLRALDVTEPATLIGHSMGGNIAALFAGIFPDRVAALVNIEGFGLPDSDPAVAPERYRQWLAAVSARRSHPGYPSLAPLIARILKTSPRMDEARAKFVAAHWARRQADGHWQLKADIAHRWPNPIPYRRAEARACWLQIAARVLLIAGADTEYDDALAGWRSPGAGGDYRDARLEVIRDAGHMVHFEQPQALAVAIEAFLTG
ncbi:MAG: alpha/beta hydrolase [Woeseia sp.]